MRSFLSATAALLLIGLVRPAAALGAPSIWPESVPLPVGTLVDDGYTRQFGVCDTAGTFRGHADRYTRGCADDPNAVTAVRRLPGGIIAYTSKLAIDLDGSAFACSPQHGRMDQCPTSLMLDDGHGGEGPVDADAIPYVVIPEAGPGDTQGEFSRLTGIHVGDFGVVIARGHTVPVIVADTGPYSKLGEGSLALHRMLGRDQCRSRDRDGHCTAYIPEDRMASIAGGVTTILFPHSARSNLTPATIAATTRREGSRLWACYRARLPALRAHCADATVLDAGCAVRQR